MPHVRLIVIEGDLTVEETAKLAASLGRGPVTLPPTVTGQEAVLRSPEPKPEPKVEEPAARWPGGVPASTLPLELPVTPKAPPTAAQVIQQTREVDADFGPAPVVAPAPTPAEAPPVPSALSGARKLRDVLEALRAQGVTDAGALVAECRRVRLEVPILARIADDQLDERVRRTLEGMA